MKKTILMMVLIFAAASIALASPPDDAGNGYTGMIWTTDINCGVPPDHVNWFSVGEDVYIAGEHFPEGTHYWDITGNSGNTCHPGVLMAEDEYEVDATGKFCFYAYTIKEGECGNYQVTFNNDLMPGKHFEYHIRKDTGGEVPEFTMAGAILAMVLGSAYIIKRR